MRTLAVVLAASLCGFAPPAEDALTAPKAGPPRIVELSRSCLPGIPMPTEPWTLRIGCTAVVACQSHWVKQGAPVDFRVTRGYGHIEFWSMRKGVGDLFAGAQSLPGYPRTSCTVKGVTVHRGWTVVDH